MFIQAIPKKIRRTFLGIYFKKRLQGFLQKNTKCCDSSSLVLIWELGGFPLILRKNAIFALALKVRGFNTHFIICDGTPEACIQREIEQGEKVEEWRKQCPRCLKEMKAMADKYGISYSLAGEYIDQKQKQVFKGLSETIGLDEIEEYQYFAFKVGKCAISSFLRYLKGYPLEMSIASKDIEQIYRKFFYGCLLNTYIAHQAIQKHNPVSAFSSHGVLIDYMPFVNIGAWKGINSVSWMSAYRDFCHYFTVHRDPHKPILRGLSEAEWERRKRKPLQDEENRLLDAFMFNRYFRNESSDVHFFSQPERPSVLREKLDIKNNYPVVCLFAHVNWDIGFCDSSVTLFEDSNHWVIESMRKMIEIEKVNWIIKIHPAEIVWKSAYSTAEEIKKQFKHLPGHLKVLRADSAINTYGLYQFIDAGITILGSAGIELPLLGKPVILAGGSHLSGKGFSWDAKTKEEYFHLLENVIDIRPLTSEQVALARQYAYSYFIQRQIPLNIINKAQGHWGDIDLRRLDELLPGKDPILDKICACIVSGKDVILEEKELVNIKDSQNR